MTDKDKIRAEIERLMNRFDSEYDKDPTEVKAAKGNVCHEILSFIDSLQEEPTMVDAAESLGISQEEFAKIVDECIYDKEDTLDNDESIV